MDGMDQYSSPRCERTADKPAEIRYVFESGTSESETPDVERINQFSFYELGRVLRQLRVPDRDNIRAHEIFSPLFRARGVVVGLLKGDPIPLTVSKQCAQQLQGAIQGVCDRFFYPAKPDGSREFSFPENDVVIQSWEWSSITSALEHFEAVFAEEMREAATYYVPRRGIFYTPALVDTADETFPMEIAGFIPEKSKADWRAAGRCLAFNLLTASGFHVARSVEGTLESYYQQFAAKPGETLNSWHDYIKALEKIIEGDCRPAPTAKTLAELKQMKDDYRNPIAHPRVSLSESDAKMLFANGESLIIAMAQELKEAGRTIQPALALISADVTSGP